MDKLISVIMPAYNAEKYISESIESILNQSYKNFEFIIIDDCSTDNTWNIILNYVNLDYRIKAYRNSENLKTSKTKNIALSYCTGKYIAVMDADDISEVNRFEKQLEYMEKYNLDVCGTDLIYFDENGEIGRKKYSDVTNTILIESPLCHSSSMIKKELFDKFNNYNQNINVAEDYELWLKFYSKGAKFGIVPEYLFYYRQHPNMSKSNKTKLTLKNTIKIKLNAKRNYNLKFGFKGNFRLLAEMILYLFPSKFILFLFYLKNKK